MKRYLAFYGNDYYAEGGMGDFLSDFDTIDEAKEVIEKEHLRCRKDDIEWEWAWCHIWDTDKRTIVYNRDKL